jgi:hypothetical protein
VEDAAWDAVKLVGFILATVTTPALAFMARWLRRLYDDLQKSHRTNVRLLHETLNVLRTLELVIPEPPPEPEEGGPGAEKADEEGGSGAPTDVPG